MENLENRPSTEALRPEMLNALHGAIVAIVDPINMPEALHVGIDIADTIVQSGPMTTVGRLAEPMDDPRIEDAEQWACHLHAFVTEAYRRYYLGQLEHARNHLYYFIRDAQAFLDVHYPPPKAAA